MDAILDILLQEWLLGILIGFGLGEGTRFIREKNEIKRIRRALRDELEANRFQIPQKQDVIRQMIEALGKGHYLPGSSVPPVTAIYDNHFPKVVKKLKPIERDNIHLIYSLLKKNDEFMTNFERTFKGDLDSELLEDPWNAPASRLKEIGDSYEVVRSLIEAFLDGKPKDVLYRHSGEEPPKQFLGGKITPQALNDSSSD